MVNQNVDHFRDLSARGVDDEPVFQVVDAKKSRFFESDRAEVTGDFQSMGMGVVNGRLQLYPA